MPSSLYYANKVCHKNKGNKSRGGTDLQMFIELNFRGAQDIFYDPNLSYGTDIQKADNCPN